MRNIEDFVREALESFGLNKKEQEEFKDDIVDNFKIIVDFLTEIKDVSASTRDKQDSQECINKKAVIKKEDTNGSSEDLFKSMSQDLKNEEECSRMSLMTDIASQLLEEVWNTLYSGVLTDDFCRNTIAYRKSLEHLRSYVQYQYEEKETLAFFAVKHKEELNMIIETVLLYVKDEVVDTGIANKILDGISHLLKAEKILDVLYYI